MRPPRLDRSRFRRVRGFFASVLLHAVWHEVVLGAPLLRRFRSPALPRWRAIARRYRALAVELGGVLIKLGQFLSTRVDILPPEITSELAELQDAVPAADYPAIVAQVERHLGRPIGESFASFSELPLGAASLAQVHPARLDSGEEVVVKVLRPGIEVVVETDLAAIAFALRWLRRSKTVRRFVDLDWLLSEFTAVTRRELDLLREGRSAERFAADFRTESDVLVPRVFWSHSATGVLTLENVAFMRLGDRAALEAAGVEPAALARRLYQIYMRQLFVTHFVHADPHPGNLFVRPTGEGFQVAFVDFGMMTEIPERLREAMREFVIGFGSRDARRMVRALEMSGSVLPGADVERLVDVTRTALSRFWGVPLSALRDTALAQAPSLALEFRDVILAAPIQIQADMLFALRAIGILSGLATSLDPDFDPWAETIPFALKLARGEEGGRSLLEGLGEAVGHVLRAPGQIDRLLERAERGSLVVEAQLSADARRRLERIERSVDRLGWAVVAAALLLAGVALRGQDDADLAAAGLLATATIAALRALLRR